MMHSIRCLQICRITTKHIVSSRFTKALCNIHIMPIRQIRFICPVCRITMKFPGKLQQELFSCDVIKPINTIQIIPPTAVLPIIFQEFIIGDSQLPFKVISHQSQHSLITRIFIIRLQTPKHYHIRPKFSLPSTFIHRTEKAIRLPALNSCFNPDFCFCNHSRIF